MPRARRSGGYISAAGGAREQHDAAAPRPTSAKPAITSGDESSAQPSAVSDARRDAEARSRRGSPACGRSGPSPPGRQRRERARGEEDRRAEPEDPLDAGHEHERDGRRPRRRAGTSPTGRRGPPRAGACCGGPGSRSRAPWRREPVVARERENAHDREAVAEVVARVTGEQRRHVRTLTRPSRNAAAPPCDGWRTPGPPSARSADRPTGTTRRPRRSRARNGSPAAISARVGAPVRAGSPGRADASGRGSRAARLPRARARASMRWTIVAVASAGPVPRELALGGERHAAHTRAAIAGAPRRRAGASRRARVEVRARAGRRRARPARRRGRSCTSRRSGPGDLLDERRHPHRAHSDRRRPERRPTSRGWIAEFVGGARHRLDLAHYDFHLPVPEAAAIVGGAISDAAARGVAVRFVYDVVHREPDPGAAAARAETHA